MDDIETGAGMHLRLSPPAPTRILVVAQQPLERWTLARLTAEQADMEPVGTTADPHEAMMFSYTLRPDLVIIDWASAQFGLISDMRRNTGVRAIVVTAAREDADLRFAAAEQGASAFLCKSLSVPELLAAIRQATVAWSSFTAVGYAEGVRETRATPALELTPRECDVLGLLQDGLALPSIAATLGISRSTTKTYVERLYDKLRANNRAQALMNAVALGVLSPHAVRRSS